MTGQPVIYSGQGFSPKGDKERFVLPAGFRRAVSESSAGANVLLVSKHSSWPCLIGYGLSRRDSLIQQIDREEEMAARAGQPFDRDMRYFQLFDCAEISFDGSGRFIIPAHLRKLVGIGEAIYFQGSGPFFTLWAPDVLAAQEGPLWASAQAACASLLEEPGRGRK
ncbi:MAG TPA: division/cell wall cluster transcriptional repressor MraZ [Novosphingobium sp.]|nr:division/cell wall cluster transcriptional repressor MraZ [Novosphingobium sp.]HZV08948.1 division/cell wall cluster transcriptional repressor MraZ [Novosphingobium sp.]